MKAKTLLAAAIITLSIISCRKDDDETPQPQIYTEENQLSAYLSATGFIQKTVNYPNSGDYEFGLKFTPKVKGNITAIVLKIPDNATNVRVTIWDAGTKAVLKTITIPNAPANTEVRQNIDAFAVTKDRQYFISYNGNDWYKHSKSDNSVAVYPVVAGNISFDSYQWIGGLSQTFHTNTNNDYYAGDLSFVFQQAD